MFASGFRCRPLAMWSRGSAPSRGGGGPATTRTTLFLVFLFALLSLLGLSLTLGLALGLAFTLGLLLALLNNFRFSRSCRRLRHHLRSRNHFFLHRGHVRDHLVLIGQELQLLVVREVFHAHFDAEHKVADVHVD